MKANCPGIPSGQQLMSVYIEYTAGPIRDELEACLDDRSWNVT